LTSDMPLVNDSRMALQDPKLDKLLSLIKDSFRVREDHDPIYVDLGGHLERIASDQHQVIFGRRGSGKSCLLVHYHRRARPGTTLSIYVSADEVKRLGYPDLLIRLLMMLLSGFGGSRIGRMRGIVPFLRTQAQRRVAELSALLDRAERADVTEQQERARETTMGGSAGGGGGSLTGGYRRGTTEQRTSAFVEEKLDALERHLQDYKETLRDAVERSTYDRATFFLDDFYLVHPDVQPDVIDYLHRLVRGTRVYLKVGTVRHRTSLARYDGGQTIGIELYQDAEAINLDQTFEDITATHNYLAAMLDSMGKRVGIENVSRTYLSQDGLFQLTLASGGVPRDYLNIFVEAVQIAQELGHTKWLTPTTVYKGAYRIMRRTKLVNLREDVGADAARLERVYQRLLNFCLRERRKTAFLISEEEATAATAEHELVQQLMDFKLIHVVEPDTSAASGRPGRYEAYTLDFAFFMEPRRRGIEIVKFWERDENRRRRGLREAPVFELASLAGLNEEPLEAPTEDLAAEIDAETGEPDIAPVTEDAPDDRV
jgi:hypothetical protein